MENAPEIRFHNVSWYGLREGPKPENSREQVEDRPIEEADALQNEVTTLKNRENNGLEHDEKKNIQQPYKLLASTYCKLSRNYEDNGEYPVANEFHYLSWDALRQEGWNSLGLIGTLYCALSGYGVRARRALGVLLALAVVFAVLYMLVGHPSLRVLPIEGFWPAVEEAGRALMYSLGVMTRLRPEPIPKEMGLFQILVTVEGILGPLQIALLALAIRHKVMR